MGSFSPVHWIFVFAVLGPLFVLPLVAIVKALGRREKGPPSRGWYIYGAISFAWMTISNAAMAVLGSGPTLISVMMLAMAAAAFFLWRDVNKRGAR